MDYSKLKPVMKAEEITSKKESNEDKINRFKFYDTSFSCLNFYMDMFDEDVMKSKKEKTFDVITMVEKYHAPMLFFRIRDILMYDLARKMTNIDLEDLLNGEIVFEVQDEKDIYHDADIIRDIFVEYIHFRLDEERGLII